MSLTDPGYEGALSGNSVWGGKAEGPGGLDRCCYRCDLGVFHQHGDGNGNEEEEEEAKRCRDRRNNDGGVKNEELKKGMSK